MSRGTGYNRRKRERWREGAGLPYRSWTPAPPGLGSRGTYHISIDRCGASTSAPGLSPSPRARRVPLSPLDTATDAELGRLLLERVPADLVAEWRLGGRRLSVWLEERVPRREGFMPSDVRRFGRAVSRQKVTMVSARLSSEGWFWVLDGQVSGQWAPEFVPGWSPAGRLVVVDVQVQGVGLFRVGRATRPTAVPRVVEAASALCLTVYADPGAELWLSLGTEAQRPAQ